MAEFRTACLEDLLGRLHRDLSGRHDLAHRLERALTLRDADMVTLAMDDLEHEPEPVRAMVHDAILDWLFGGDPAAGLRVLTPASPLAQ